MVSRGKSIFSNVYYAEFLAYNLLSYCKLKNRGIVLSYTNGQRYIRWTSDKSHVFEVINENNVLTLTVGVYADSKA